MSNVNQPQDATQTEVQNTANETVLGGLFDTNDSVEVNNAIVKHREALTAQGYVFVKPISGVTLINEYPIVGKLIVGDLEDPDTAIEILFPTAVTDALANVDGSTSLEDLKDRLFKAAVVMFDFFGDLNKLEHGEAGTLSDETKENVVTSMREEVYKQVDGLYEKVKDLIEANAAK